MPELTHDQIAGLLLGITRMNRAIISGLSQGNPQVTTAVIGALQGAANLGNRQAQPTLSDLPARVMLQMVNPPTHQQQAQLDTWLRAELTRLLP